MSEMVKSATRANFTLRWGVLRNRCLHLATGRTRDDKREESGNDGGEKRSERGRKERVTEKAGL
ncbi:hypothetical protein TNCV_1300541, partial [Trichonephila clavipes]